ncbi:hypothetical protein ABEH29_10295 [Pantoea agglomerans]|uniref:hypothetical protein n=1 Tax=Enterobacter agglomerans TaxID=549 RepID=UPI001654954D|nr:hypothetical protein [Pantoea agglomerans]
MSSTTTQKACPSEITGSLLTIVHCESAWDTFLVALESIQEAKRESIKHRMDVMVKALADGKRLSRDSFPPEGMLPCLQGKQAKQFYAFKKIPIRAYGWYSETKPKKFFISHYIFKNTDKLSKSDTTIVQRNWTRIEVNGDEK